MYGTPAIAGRSGGVPEAVVDEETGLIVEPLNVDAIVCALTRLFDDEAFRRKLGTQARARALEKFTANRQAARVHEILVETAAGTRELR